MRFGDLPNDLRRKEVKNYFDKTTGSTRTNSVLVFGSPGEASNSRNEEFLILSASDQLRQRVAGALSQVSLEVGFP